MSKVEWAARWSGEMEERAVLIRGGAAVPQREFARRVRHIPGGSELYRAYPDDGDIILYLYRSGSGRTENVRMIWPDTGQIWDSFDEAEIALGLVEGSLTEAFWG